MIWRMEYGRESLPARIDHSNRDKMDNRLENLRPATVSLNSLNSRHPRKVHQFSGVTPNKGSAINPFQATINHQSRHIHLGVFPTEQAASEAYEAARGKLIEYEAAIALGQQPEYPDLCIVRGERGRPCVEVDVDEAARLYASGLSLAAVAEKFGCDGSTIKNKLAEAGIPRRKRGRPKKATRTP